MHLFGTAAESVAVQRTLVVPIGNTVPEAGVHETATGLVASVKLDADRAYVTMAPAALVAWTFEASTRLIFGDVGVGWGQVLSD